MSLRTAARVAGIAVMIMFVAAYVVSDVLLDNFVVPGDADQLALDIQAEPARFARATVGYLLLLMADGVVALSLYVVLRPASRALAALTAALRLLYVAISLVNLGALAMQVVDTHVYGTIKLGAYVVFVLHLASLSYVAYVSRYVPGILALLLLVASLAYVPAFFLGDLVSVDVKMLCALLMMAGELALGLWLLATSARLDRRVAALGHRRRG